MLWIFYPLCCFVSGHAGPGAWGEFSNDGWTPVTRERVFHSLERKVIPQDYNQHQYNHPVLQKSSNNQDNLNRIFEPSTDKVNYNKDYSEGDEEQKVLSNERHRKAKYIHSNHSTDSIKNVVPANFIKTINKSGWKEELTSAASFNQYEVTERTEAVQPARDEGNVEAYKSTHAQYHEVNATSGATETTNDFTTKLLSILSSYNIRVNDILPNYELSRDSKPNAPTQEFVLLPIPIRYSSKYNNLAFEPLLTVLLSNFGYYYSPGQYGSLKRFNSYGQLASNIPNNQPFGSYKIYSDTDSSQ